MTRFDTPLPHPNFEDHQAGEDRRVVTFEDVEDVWYEEFAERFFVPNRKRQGSYLMYGLTRGRRPITVVILPTGDPTTWLVYTAW